MKTELKLDWCSHEAAKYAVEKWHYSHSMPAGKIVKIGAWENQCFIGAILFSLGANNNIGSPYKLKQIEVCELTRIALTTHTSPVSRIAAIAIKMLKKQSPGLRLIVSYADPAQDHHGGIYQAMGWIYEGVTDKSKLYKLNGKFVHQKTASSALISIAGVDHITTEGKHKYLYPLDAAMRTQIAPIGKPYPKRDTLSPMRLSSSSKMSIDQIEDSGANPTQTLHNPHETAL